MIYRFKHSVLFVFIFPFLGFSQDSLKLISINASWDDAYHEWDFHYLDLSEDEEEVGEIEATWAHLEDWKEWDVSVGNFYGNIRQKWRHNDQLWELSAGSNVTTIKTKWNNDYSEWIINFNGQIKIRWLAEKIDDGNVWFFDHQDYGVFEFITEFENDPRDWLIYDDTIQLPLDIKVACCFIAMYRSTVAFRG